MQPEINQEGLKDSLTGVYSRATMNARLYDEMERAHRYNTLFSLILLDIDHFKSINDAFGHARGDKALVELAYRMGALTRNSDLIFRYGGDEFVILLPHTDKLRAITIAQRLLEGIRSVPFHGEPPLTITLSIGVASFPTEAQNLEGLFELADQRQYRAKQAGRDRVVSEETNQPINLPETRYQSPQRLIERDQALMDLSGFLNALPKQKTGALQIAGMTGSGKSRFLAETRKIVQLRGYMALTLEANTALKVRLYGAVAEAQAGWTELASPMSGKENFSASTKRILNEKELAGLVILIDNLPELDWATLRFLRDMLSSNDLPQFALIYTADLYHSPKSLPSVTSLQTYVTLEPLSQEAIHIWLRSSLHWEAPLDFVEWLHRETTGLPANIESGLGYLIKHEILQQSGESWVCHQDLNNIPLAVVVKKETNPPSHNLPRYATDFIGRTEEIKTIKHLINEFRLITLRGPGGIGKTRLAIQAAAESLDLFPQGAYLISLSQINSTELLVVTIAEALQFAISNPEDTQTQLLNYLRGKELLRNCYCYWIISKNLS